MDALFAFYAALVGGVETLMGLSIRRMRHDAAGPPGFPRGLLTDLRRVAVASANNLRDDLVNNREGQAVWADSLSGYTAIVTTLEANPRTDLPPVPSASLHLSPAFGTFAHTLRAILSIASGLTLGDAVNAFCSMKRSVIQRGVLKFEKKLLPAYDFLYGPNATGSCCFYAAGGVRPLGSCQMNDGVTQGDGLGPLLFSLGLDELLTAVREAMRDLAQCG